jgi:hypothetical protein
VDARVARVGLLHGACKTLRDRRGDLEGGLREADADRAHLVAADAAAPADEG